MITLLSLLFGFITSCLPSVLKIWQDKSDKAQELAIMQLQMQANQAVVTEKLHEIELHNDMDGLKIRYETYKSDNRFVNLLNGLVRPAYAYGFLFLYIFINFIYYQNLQGLPPAAFADLMWTEADNNILGSVIGFYFGARANEKIMS
jgi:hypothetical protein